VILCKINRKWRFRKEKQVYHAGNLEKGIVNEIIHTTIISPPGIARSSAILPNEGKKVLSQ
jgi:hypothetical protein